MLVSLVGAVGLVAVGLSPTLVPLGELGGATQHVRFAARVALGDDGKAYAREALAAGESLVEWQEGAVLTAPDCYVDLDVGLPLKRLAARVGPGFETVALATLLGAEVIRDYKTRQQSYAAEGGDDRAFRELVESPWAHLTRRMWSEHAQFTGHGVDTELQPLASMAVNMMMPILDSTSRRLWSSGKAGRSTGELIDIAGEAIALVLREQASPPSDDGRWGWREGAPEGLALLSHMRCLTDGSGNENATLGCPTKPEAGSKGEGVCLHCVATRDIAVGEPVVV